MMNNIVTIVLVLVGLAASSLSASAKTSYLGDFSNWGVYRNTSLSKDNCYALTTPVESLPSNVDHGDNFVIVSRIDGKYSPQLAMGYPLKSSAALNVRVDDGARFSFFSDDNRAWTQKAADEPRLIKEMRGGKILRVHAVSARGTHTRYTFSLMGLSAALKRIAQCR
ncbi:MAG: hypothetical protein J0H18_18100 [Rhizobiales bacterium]|nr:hypothetical protein [Hyphomicrobiales bacterium]OJY04977.1 MAG: hypothetical protein BGP07_09860 [Rhizobiales bacterium 63-22]